MGLTPPAEKKLGRPIDPTLRSRREEEILDAAANLFAEHGYAETETQTLADRLQVGKGTVYRYFPSKEKLFLAAVDRVMVRLGNYIDERIEGVQEDLELIARAIHAYLVFFAEHPHYVELLIQERAQFKDREKPTYFKHRDANIGPWRELFQRLIAAGRLRAVPVERITDVIGDLVYGTMFTNYFTGRRAPPAEQAKDILDIFFNGVLSARERRRRGGE